jgi:solute carrier family 45, member 1/2/4
MDDSARKERELRSHARRETAASASRPRHTRNASMPSQLWTLGSESDPRTPLLRRRSLIADIEDTSKEFEVGTAPVAGGTILGIHNLAIVFPQFLVSVPPYGGSRGRY